MLVIDYRQRVRLVTLRMFDVWRSKHYGIVTRWYRQRNGICKSIGQADSRSFTLKTIPRKRFAKYDYKGYDMNVRDWISVWNNLSELWCLWYKRLFVVFRLFCLTYPSNGLCL